MKSLIVFLVLLCFPCFAFAQDKTDEVLRQLVDLQRSITLLRNEVNERVKKVEKDFAEVKDFKNNITKLSEQVSQLQSQIEEIKKERVIVKPISTLKPLLIEERVRPMTEQERMEGDRIGIPKDFKFEAPIKIPERIVERRVREEPKRTGTIAFDSTYSYPIRVTCNGETFTLNNGDQRNIEVPEGIYTYMVSGVHAGLQSRTIRAGETQRINVHHIAPAPTQQYFPRQYYVQPQYYCPAPVYYYNPCWRQ